MTPGTSGKPGINRVHEILVVGAGPMGSQIAMLCALAGYRATATDITRGALRRAETDLRARAGRSVDKGRLTRHDADAAFSRLTLTTDLDTAAASSDFVIEAAAELLDVNSRSLPASTPPHRHTPSSPPTPPRSSPHSSLPSPRGPTESPTCTSSAPHW